MFSKVKIILIAVIFILFLFPQVIHAQVVINEVSPASNPEWIELYNDSGENVDLTGWKLIDAANHLKTISIATVSAQGFFVFENPEGWLNNSGQESLFLKNTSDEVIDSVVYGTGGVVGAPDTDKSIGRSPDGSSNWVNNLVWTKGSPNPTPTPSPTPPTPTPAPTSTSTPSPSPTPSKTPTPTPKKTPTPSPTLNPMQIASDSATGQSEVQGIRNEMNLLGVASESAGITDKKGPPIIPIILISCGGIFIIGAGLALAKKGKSEYNLKKDEGLTQNN